MSRFTTHQRVLVVDDDPAFVAAIVDGLELLGGYDTVVAPDGAAGIDHFFELAPDCVVVDVRMPQVNGYQLVRALRGDPKTAHIPIVILSAMAQDHEQLIGFLSGADSYLLKPIKFDDLLAAIDDAVHLTPEERQERAEMLARDAMDG